MMQIEKIFIQGYLKKVINCYCLDCIANPPTIHTAPKQIEFNDTSYVFCPCDGCLHSYPKNNIRLIKLETQTICSNSTQCYDCLKYKITILEFELNNTKPGFNKRTELDKQRKTEQFEEEFKKRDLRKQEALKQEAIKQEQLKQEQLKLDIFREKIKKQIKESIYCSFPSKLPIYGEWMYSETGALHLEIPAKCYYMFINGYISQRTKYIRRLFKKINTKIYIVHGYAYICASDLEEQEREKREQEKREQEKREQEKREQEKREQEKREQEKREQEKREQEKREQEKREKINVHVKKFIKFEKKVKELVKKYPTRLGENLKNQILGEWKLNTSHDYVIKYKIPYESYYIDIKGIVHNVCIDLLRDNLNIERVYTCGIYSNQIHTFVYNPKLTIDLKNGESDPKLTIDLKNGEFDPNKWFPSSLLK